MFWSIEAAVCEHTCLLFILPSVHYSASIYFLITCSVFYILSSYVRADPSALGWSIRGWTQLGVVMCVPADRDEVFSLHADAPGRRLFRCQTHSHCCLHAARLHPAAAPGPLRDPCPGQDPSLRGPSVLQTPAVLCGGIRGGRCCCWRRTGQRAAASHTRSNVTLPGGPFKVTPPFFCLALIVLTV